ncbi:Hypothetical protein HEAR1875 [Herminiimonas arsenicoxydans]|uniref:Uncharacterized protein n=1 Tax=Herminiimonas arsenicoxydans TaxID=204773 RepID=A4G689_HERAR|nr:Hypothetical protein HEAR1875 [Herminiimonas arsenicoxydans]
MASIAVESIPPTFIIFSIQLRSGTIIAVNPYSRISDKGFRTTPPSYHARQFESVR